MVIWTTTPWTIPANLGICIHPQFRYAAVKTKEHGILIVAKELVGRVMQTLDIEDFQVMAELNAPDLEKENACTPFTGPIPWSFWETMSLWKLEPVVFIQLRATEPTTMWWEKIRAGLLFSGGRQRGVFSRCPAVWRGVYF